MLHSIQTDQYGPLGAPMTHAVETCVHCGFCLAACPTYGELGQEMDTPRGRIVLMKQALEGTLPWEDAQPHVDRCLGCLACEPACPSGVPYRDLISPFRALSNQKIRRSLVENAAHFLTSRTIPYPNRFRLAVRAARFAKPFASFFPSALRPMFDLAPNSIPAAQHWPARTPAIGERRARVALLTGCAQSVIEPDINTATIQALAIQGVEVMVPENQSCCGGLAWHAGDLRAARRFASRVIGSFPNDVDAILSNAAGCGSAMREYPLILRGTSGEKEAEAFRLRVMDATKFLARLGLREFPSRAFRPHRVAYQDACHLANGQGVTREPRALLRAIPGVELIELPDNGLCCGSAGTYNLSQPAIAAALGEKKARAAMASGAETVATGNIGCMTQMRFHLARLGSKIKVAHVMQLLRDGLA